MDKQEYEAKRGVINNRMESLKAELKSLNDEYALTLTDIRVGDRIEYGYNTRAIGEVVGIALSAVGVKYDVRRIKKKTAQHQML